MCLHSDYLAACLLGPSLPLLALCALTLAAGGLLIYLSYVCGCKLWWPPHVTPACNNQWLSRRRAIPTRYPGSQHRVCLKLRPHGCSAWLTWPRLGRPTVRVYSVSALIKSTRCPSASWIGWPALISIPAVWGKPKSSPEIWWSLALGLHSSAQWSSSLHSSDPRCDAKRISDWWVAPMVLVHFFLTCGLIVESTLRRLWIWFRSVQTEVTWTECTVNIDLKVPFYTYFFIDFFWTC